jgi:hypothetical protein
MEHGQMLGLAEQHPRAEGAGDMEGAVAVYTDDIEHDAVGFPGSRLHGKEASTAFREHVSIDTAAITRQLSSS